MQTWEFEALFQSSKLLTADTSKVFTASSDLNVGVLDVTDNVVKEN